MLYGIIAIVLSEITIERKSTYRNYKKEIYLNTNGVHLDIIIPISGIDKISLTDIKHDKHTKFMAFGWGDKDFYLKSPTWNDISIGTAFKAICLPSKTLIHVTRHQQKQADWIKVLVTKKEIDSMCNYIENSFYKTNNKKIVLENKGYDSSDDFYMAKGSYSLFKTCNSWVNTAFKDSSLRACYWTPFDFSLINKYKN